mmetsp:Transcript_73539/g.175380  ORF Transcript_73539/g.175380 Transcript_73539/m.175380 type:complete len:83 (+) Transcript_73539:273-521(+)
MPTAAAAATAPHELADQAADVALGDVWAEAAWWLICRGAVAGAATNASELINKAPLAPTTTAQERDISQATELPSYHKVNNW